MITHLLSPPASAPLCHDCCITLGAQNIHHKGIRGQDASLQHGEDSGITTGHQSDTPVIDLDGLLLISASHIPEHHFRQLISILREEPLCILEVGQGTIFSAVVELHIGDDVDLGGHLELGHTILHSSLQDQLKHSLDVGVCNLIELVAVLYLFVDVFSLDLHQLGVLGECNEVIVECAGVALGIVDTQRQRHSGGDGISPIIHGTGAIDDNQGILAASKVFLGLPSCINGLSFLIRDMKKGLINS